MTNYNIAYKKVIYIYFFKIYHKIKNRKDMISKLNYIIYAILI